MGIKYSVVDIAKDAKNNVTTTYYGRNGYTITLSRIDNPRITKEHGNDEKQSLKNYKQYHHKIPEDNAWWSVYYQLQRVEHNGIEQTGFEEKGYLKTHKALEVVYWSNDEHNSLPLIIGLGEGKPIYFKRKNETNRWEYSNIVPPADLSDYNKVLEGLNKTFSDVVIVNLNADKDKKYCGHPSLNCFKSPKDSSESNCSQDSTSFVTITVSEITGGTVPSGFKCLKHSSSGNKMRVLGTYHGDSMISFTESTVATECGYVNAYYTSESRNDKPLLLELSNGADQGTSKLYTLGNNKWVPSNLSKNDLTQVLDYENCMRNNIVLADVSKKEDYHCKCENKHRRIEVVQNTHDLPDESELYEHTIKSTGGRETPEPSFNKYRFMDDIKDVTLPESLMTEVKKIYVYLCKSNTNMQLLIYMDNGSEPGKWLRKSYGDKTWTEANSVSLSGIKPTDSNSKDKIGKELHKIAKELSIGCQHEDSASSGSSPGSAGSVGNSGSQGHKGELGTPDGPQLTVAPVSPSGGEQNFGGGSNGGSTPSSSPESGSPTSENTQDSANTSSGSPGEGIQGPTGPGTKSPESDKTPTEKSETDNDDQSRGDKTFTDKKGPFQTALTFIRDHHDKIVPSVGGVLGTGILGLAIWKAPAIFSRVLAIFITSV
ncbi:hypothetical protein BEWA_054770 [Theileria equi strain WA]|uniref:Uncharacterized protein n=1 Tax=Theileria equi strain WA TaxID=1537102 RepID=L1LDU6_THEEQ|nr:hypothetical protein BEWA_054770 [Theileria equi strain WA]EKX73420.1 hypothetical protein BEWA_054770 [Theileria equi strain WA]|eukprot:XP_004832872.1 hypothetical protein BEWA_054770 [Theileria equi strain WA]